MPVEGRVHLIDLAVMRPGVGVDARVVELAVIHDANLPLMLAPANPDATLEIMDNSAQVLEQFAFLSVDHGNQLVVIGVSAAPPASGQRRERPYIATAELSAQAFDATDAWCLAPQVPRAVVEPAATPAGQPAKIEMPTAPLA